MIRYSRGQYRWKADGENGHPVKNDPPSRTRVGAGEAIVLPYSLAVLRYDPAP